MSHFFPAAMFWVGVCGTLYSYIGFPVLISALARRRTLQGHPTTSEEPTQTLSVIIPAYNEEESIDTKIRNTLACDYPRDLLDVTVVSDASTDRTNEIVASFAGDGVRLILQERRQGKTAGLNRAVASARGDILVLTDANAAFGSDVLRTLTRRFKDPTVGLVTGYTRYKASHSGDVAKITNAYTLLERLIKRAESRWGCCVGADGAIFAMRRSLYRTLRDDDINDFVLPLGVIDQGFHCVFAEDAFCSESPGTSIESEFRRQSRITSRTLRALWRNAHLLNPFDHPMFAFLLASHKVSRFLVPFFVLASAVALMVLARQGGPYLSAALGGLVVLAAILVSPLMRGGTPLARVLQMLHAFLTVNVAVLDGWRKFLSGRSDVIWQHDRTSFGHSGEHQPTAKL